MIDADAECFLKRPAQHIHCIGIYGRGAVSLRSIAFFCPEGIDFSAVKIGVARNLDNGRLAVCGIKGDQHQHISIECGFIPSGA